MFSGVNACRRPICELCTPITHFRIYNPTTIDALTLCVIVSERRRSNIIQEGWKSF